MSLTAALIEESIERSVKALGLDYVDVLALHEPTIEDAAQPEIFSALENVRARGDVRALSIAGSRDVALAFLNASQIFRIAQLANDPFSRNLTRLPQAVRDCITTVTHGAFGVAGPYARLTTELATDASMLARFHGCGFTGTPATSAGIIPSRLFTGCQSKWRLSGINEQGVPFGRRGSIAEKKSHFERSGTS